MKVTELNLLVRAKFIGQDRKRLLWTLGQVGHAWKNLFVERIKPVTGKEWAHRIGNVLAVLSGLIILSGLGALSALVLHILGRVFS